MTHVNLVHDLAYHECPSSSVVRLVSVQAIVGCIPFQDSDCFFVPTAHHIMNNRELHQ